MAELVVVRSMTALAEKSRFRLTMEISVCQAIVVFVFLFFGLSNIFAQLVLWPPLLYQLRLAKHLKTRHDVLTKNEKSIIFGFGLFLNGGLVLIFLVIALYANTPLAWIVCSVVAVIAAAQVYLSYRKLYIENT